MTKGIKNINMKLYPDKDAELIAFLDDKPISWVFKEALTHYMNTYRGTFTEENTQKINSSNISEEKSSSSFQTEENYSTVEVEPTVEQAVETKVEQVVETKVEPAVETVVAEPTMATPTATMATPTVTMATPTVTTGAENIIATPAYPISTGNSLNNGGSSIFKAMQNKTKK